MNKIICTLLATFSISALADFDLKTSLAGRSYPSLGATVALQMGYSVPLWGTPSKDNPIYGLMRVNLNTNSSVVVSGYDSSLTIYPISFMGFGAGQKIMKSEYNEFSYYDCEDIRCEGELRKDYTFYKLALGAGPLISFFKYTDFRNSYTDEENKKQGVAEYEDVIIATAKNDTSSKHSYFLGLNLGDSQLGILSDNAKYHVSQQYYKMNVLVYRKSIDKLSYSLGIGGLETSHQEDGTVIVYQLAYEFFPSLALF